MLEAVFLHFSFSYSLSLSLKSMISGPACVEQTLVIAFYVSGFLS